MSNKHAYIRGSTKLHADQSIASGVGIERLNNWTRDGGSLLSERHQMHPCPVLREVDSAALSGTEHEACHVWTSNTAQQKRTGYI